MSQDFEKNRDHKDEEIYVVGSNSQSKVGSSGLMTPERKSTEGIVMKDQATNIVMHDASVGNIIEASLEQSVILEP